MTGNSVTLSLKSPARSLYDLILSPSNHSACCSSCKSFTSRRRFPGLDFLSGFGVDRYGGNPGAQLKHGHCTTCSTVLAAPPAMVKDKSGEGDKTAV